MKRKTRKDSPVRTLTIAVAIFIVMAAPAVTQEDEEARAPWILADHDMSTEGFSEDIGDIIASGYLPVGMELNGSTLSALYTDRPDIQVDRWAIQEFERLDNLNQELSEPMAAGWVPMAFSKTDSGLVVLLIETEDIQIEGWNIAIGPIETESIGQTFAAWRERGFTAYGITAAANQEMWYLLLDLAGDETPQQVFFDAYSSDDVQDGISEQMARGGRPWGLMRLGDSYFVPFLF